MAKPVIRQAEAQRQAEEFAVFIGDDSILEKAHTDANELICTHYDHSQQHFGKGLNFVTLLYQAGDIVLPIATERVAKTLPVSNTKTQQTSYQSVFTKNEYASAENMSLVRALGHEFIFALESSRTVARSVEARPAGQF